MGKIDLSINKVGLEHNIQKAKENNVIIPTIAEMQHPETIPEKGHLMVVPDIPNDDSPEDPGQAEERGSVGRQPPQPLPHHLEE